MASLVTQNEIDIFTGDFENLFDTFKRPITVFKKPKKVVSASNVNDQNIYFGYDSQNVEPDVVESYEPVSGVFEVMIRYKDNQQSDPLEELNTNSFEGDVRIKVQEDCRNYIKNGKTENIQFDNKTFNVVGDDAVKYFFGYKLYVFHLKATK
jgi:hypothetical protein